MNTNKKITISNVILGNGFSAYCVHNKLRNKKINSLVVAPYSYNDTNLKRNFNFSYNRLAHDKSYSATKLNWNLDNIHFVDRLSNGGNSLIWGGYIDLDLVNYELFKSLKEISYEKINKKDHGITSNKNLAILKNKSNDTIFDTTAYFKSYADNINGYANKIEIKNKRVYVYIENRNDNYIVEAKSIFICISVPQLVELLWKSSFINSDDILTLFDHDYKILNEITYDSSMIGLKDCLIQYNLLPALSRFFGFRRIKFPLFLPSYFNLYQHFINKRNRIDFSIKNNNVSLLTINMDFIFGKSIHYHNLLINEIQINNYIKKISKNIKFFGHPAITPNEPGPISQYMINQII
jgi:hypothetical protein